MLQTKVVIIIVILIISNKSEALSADGYASYE